MAGAIEQLAIENLELSQALVKATEALEWYADPKNHELVEGETRHPMDAHVPSIEDEGKLARATLAELHGKPCDSPSASDDSQRG